MDVTKIAIKGTTQDHLQIADIVDDLAILKDGSVALIIQVSAVNFGLLSEQEQESIIFAYAGLLNSLNFSIQIVIRSQQKDVSAYMALLEAARKKQKNPLLANQIDKYRDFIAATVKNNNVLDKKFYIAIPFSFLELGISSNAGGLFKRKSSGLPIPAESIVEKAKTALLPKRDHILRQLGRLGLRAKQLSTSELIDLFYDIYNHHTAPLAAEKIPPLIPTIMPVAAAPITDLPVQKSVPVQAVAPADAPSPVAPTTPPAPNAAQGDTTVLSESQSLALDEKQQPEASMATNASTPEAVIPAPFEVISEVNK